MVKVLKLTDIQLTMLLYRVYIHFSKPQPDGLCEHKIQKNVNGSNTDGSFTMVVSNSFLSPLEKIP